MAGSGRLVAEIAKALAIPNPSAMTTLKALRADKKVLDITGRGSSATQMTADDAIAIIVGIMSSTVSADVARVTRKLLDMPLQHRPWKSWSGLASLAQHVLRLPEEHTFKDAFGRIFSRAWRTPEQEEEERAKRPDWANEEPNRPYDPLSDPDALRVTIAVNGYRTEGFATVEARITENKTVKNYYSTRPRRPGVGEDTTPDGLGLGLYDDAPTFVFAGVLDGRAMRVLGEVLADPLAAGKRSRKHRQSAGTRTGGPA